MKGVEYPRNTELSKVLRLKRAGMSCEVQSFVCYKTCREEPSNVGPQVVRAGTVQWITDTAEQKVLDTSPTLLKFSVSTCGTFGEQRDVHVASFAAAETMQGFGYPVQKVAKGQLC